MHTSPQVAIKGLKLRAVFLNRRFPASSLRWDFMMDKSAFIDRSNTYSEPSNVCVGLSVASTVPKAVLVKKAGIPAPPARSFSANVP